MRSLGANTSRPGSTPRATASRRRLALARASASSSHSTLPGTPASRRIQMPNISSRDLVGAVERAEDETRLRQAARGARRRLGRDLAAAIVRLIAVGQMDDPLREVRLRVHRRHEGVGDDVVDEVGAHAAGIAQEVDLQGRRPKRQDLGPGVLGVALQVDEDVDAVIVDAPRGLRVRELAHVDEAIERRPAAACACRCRRRR